jgi:hypothetical protein
LKFVFYQKSKFKNLIYYYITINYYYITINSKVHIGLNYAQRLKDQWSPYEYWVSRIALIVLHEMGHNLAFWENPRVYHKRSEKTKVAHYDDEEEQRNTGPVLILVGGNKVIDGMQPGGNKVIDGMFAFAHWAPLGITTMSENPLHLNDEVAENALAREFGVSQRFSHHGIAPWTGKFVSHQGGSLLASILSLEYSKTFNMRGDPKLKLKLETDVN